MLDELLQKALTLYSLKGIHPAAELIPSMETEQYNALVEDIRANGFLNTVKITKDGLVLDGRHRLCASIDIGLDAPLEQHNPIDPVQYVVSENVKRRHLTAGQLAMIALDVEKQYAKEAKERQGKRNDLKRDNFPVPGPESKGKQEGESAKKAADTVGVGTRSVQRARKVSNHPDLSEKVKQGEPLKTAYREAVQREKQSAAQPEPKETPTDETIILHDYQGTAVEYPKAKAKSTFNRTNDAIQWAWWTWNPVTGCLHDCRYCYARELASKESFRKTFPAGFTPLLRHDRLSAPANTTFPVNSTEPESKRVFVCSMADLFGDWVPGEWITKVMDAANTAPDWEYLFLTKNPARYKDVILPKTAWAGVTLDAQNTAQAKADTIKAVEAKVRWVSMEPLLEPIDIDFRGIDWVVIGAMSGTRQPNGETVKGFAPAFGWVSDIVRKAKECGCHVYLKPNLLGQTSDQMPGMVLPRETPI